MLGSDGKADLRGPWDLHLQTDPTISDQHAVLLQLHGELEPAPELPRLHPLLLADEVDSLLPRPLHPALKARHVRMIAVGEKRLQVLILESAEDQPRGL